MKKIATLMLLLAIAGSANADLVLKGTDIEVCPGVLTKSGESVAYSQNGGVAYIYSPDFLVDKTITVPGGQYISFTEEATVIPTGVTVVPEDQYGNKNYSMSNARLCIFAFKELIFSPFSIISLYFSLESVSFENSNSLISVGLNSLIFLSLIFLESVMPSSFKR